MDPSASDGKRPLTWGGVDVHDNVDAPLDGGHVRHEVAHHIQITVGRKDEHLVGNPVLGFVLDCGFLHKTLGAVDVVEQETNVLDP